MYEFIKKLIEMMFQDLVGFTTLFFGIIGGGFALYQWRKSNVYKRGEIVKNLIEKVRDDEDIATIMDIIDWNNGLVYDGKFYIEDTDVANTISIEDNELFKKIDKTLSHFSYICYLKHNNTLTDKDMKIFDYEIRRLVDNEHVVNYLYSLFHWSSSLNVSMSFEYLIKYSIKKGYIKNDFREVPSKHYTQYLKLPTTYYKSNECLTIK